MKRLLLIGVTAILAGVAYVQDVWCSVSCCYDADRAACCQANNGADCCDGSEPICQVGYQDMNSEDPANIQAKLAKRPPSLEAFAQGF